MLSADWTYQHKDNVGHLGPSHMITTGDNIAQQIENMVRQDFVVYRVVVTETCDACRGTGRVPHKRNRLAHVTCKLCKGHDGPLSTFTYPVPLWALPAPAYDTTTD